MNKQLPAAILGVGCAAVAAYLNVNGQESVLLWIGVFFCFWAAIGD